MSGVPPVRISYTEAWLSVPDQVAKLQARGLQIPDLVDAVSFLYHVNYYSFAGHCLAFENPQHSFPVGITFEQIKFAYMFDMTLRDLLNEALELIEIDLCTAVAYSFGQTYGPFGHVDPTNFHRKFDFKTTHADWQNANFVSNQRLFSTLLLMRKMMFRSSQINSLADQWRDRVTTLLLAPPAVASPSTLMGLPNNWQQHPVWL